RLRRGTTREGRGGAPLSPDRLRWDQVGLVRAEGRNSVGTTSVRRCTRRVRQRWWNLSHRGGKTRFHARRFALRAATRGRFPRRGGRVRIRVRSVARTALPGGAGRLDSSDTARGVLLRNTPWIGAISSGPVADLGRFRQANRVWHS